MENTINTIKYDVEEAIKDNAYTITQIVAGYYAEQGFAMTGQEFKEVQRILRNIQIKG